MVLDQVQESVSASVSGIQIQTPNILIQELWNSGDPEIGTESTPVKQFYTESNLNLFITSKAKLVKFTFGIFIEGKLMK